MAAALIAEEWRGLWLYNRLHDFAVANARSLGVSAVFGQSTTAHVVSQRLGVGSGYQFTALMIGGTPPTMAKGQIKRGAQVFPVGGDTVKSLLFARLRHNDPGAGYLHFFPTTPSDYFEELTAEKQVMRFKNGFPERHWVKRPNAANEAVDELVYGYAALHRLYMVYDKRTIWDQMERKLEGEQKPAEDRKKVASQRKKSFVSQW